MRTVIHRDRTLTYNGHTYSVLAGGREWGYSIHSESGAVVADGFDRLRDVRAYVDWTRSVGLERLGEDLRRP